MNHYIKVLNAPDWTYWFFWISSLTSLTIYIVMQIKVLKRTNNLKFKVFSFFLPIFVAYPAVITYKIITQLDIFPRYVKLIEIDFSSLKDTPAAMSSIRSTAMEHGGSCINNVCTMQILLFKHNAHETWVKFGEESAAVFYCNCISPIDYKFGKNALVAKVKI